MKVNVKLLGCPEQTNIELNYDANLRELRSKIADALGYPWYYIIIIIEAAEGEGRACNIYADDPVDKNFRELFEERTGRALSESDELKANTVLNLGPGNYRPTRQNPRGLSAHCGNVDNPNSNFFIQALYKEDNERSFSKRAEKVSCTKFPDEFCDPITQELMNNPIIASDQITYDLTTFHSIGKNQRNISPYTKEDISDSSPMDNLLLRSKIDTFLSKLELNDRLTEKIDQEIKRLKRWWNPFKATSKYKVDILSPHIRNEARNVI